MTGSFDYNPSTSVVTNVAITVTFPGGTGSPFFINNAAVSSISTIVNPPNPNNVSIDLSNSQNYEDCGTVSVGGPCIEFVLSALPTSPGTYTPGQDCGTGEGLCGSGEFPSIFNNVCTSCNDNAAYQLMSGSLIVTQLGKQLGNNTVGQCYCGDPVDPSNGNVFEQFVDYETAGQNKLAFIRYYNSLGSANTTYASWLGNGWRTNFDRYLRISSSTAVTAERANGQLVNFTLVGSTWTPDSDVDITLTTTGETWTLTDQDDTVETYNVVSSGTEGLLSTIKTRNGYTQTLSYSGTKLQSVIDSYNRSLTFTYSGNALLEVTTPEGNNLIYTVSGAGYALSQVQFPTSPGTSVTYNYSDTFPDALTSVVDENDNTYETWTYDSQERALTSQLGSGANLTTLVYNSNGTTTVTNALGVADTYTFTTLQGIPKVTGISRAATGTTAAASETITYDANGYQASITDWNGNQTTYVNNSHGLPTTINEAVGSSVARATTITYDSTWTRLPATIVTPGVTVGRTYDSQGEELTTKLSDTTSNTIPYSTNGQTRTTTRTWLNQLLSSIETPNGNTTHFGYSSSGALTSVTDPLSHVTNITSYTGGGLPKTIVDPNGVTTTLTYSPRQWLMSTAVSGSGGTFTTTYTFDAAGNLTQTKLPDNSYLTLTFDTAHRITRITDTLGNYINYTLDALGDRTTVDYDDSTGAVYKNYSDSFDALGRELVHTGGRGQTVTTAYDANGNATSIKDGNGHATVNAYDALNRLHTTTDPNSGVTTLTLDAHDRTTNVQDANTHSTAYIYNGFGDRTQQVSPDSGTTVYYFDGDANLTKKTDALGVTVNMTYDTLDRILTKTFPADSTQNVGYTYDDTGYGPFTFGIGRLSAITDASGSRYLGYDERGNIITNQHVNGSSNYNIYHTYDAAGRLSGISYPSGIFVGYSHDTVGNINEVFVDPSGSSTAQVVAYMGYDPFGPMDYITYGSGITGPFSHDRDYNITNITETGTSGTIENLTYTLDNNNNVSTITNSLNSADNQTNGYDIINRLTSAVSGTGGYGSYSWTYDKVGNRLTQTAGSTTTTYGYTSGTNRLASLSGGMTATITTNANGNITNIPTANTGASATYTYNVANRASSVTGSPIGATFVYDDFGQRFKKTESGSAPSYYTYGEDGALLEESNGTTVTDYIYANGRPIGMFLPVSGGTSGNMYYVHTDQLGTPQFVTNGSQAKVWSTTYQPFGTTGTITSSLTTQNLRLPGQQFDVETGFYYNHFRDLMPPFGRYLEADPSGLEGGANAYLYANAAPSKYVDLKGLVTANLTLPWDLTYPANEAYNPPGVFSYAGHGNEYDPNSLYATHSAETGVSPQFVGDYIMNHGWDQKQTIVAVQCFGTKGGDNSFVAQLAQYLANKTNKTVNIVGSPDEVLPERWHIIGTSIYTGGADPGPDGWQLITRTPQ